MAGRHVDLGEIARRAMVAHGLEPRFPADAMREVAALDRPAGDNDATVQDLRARTRRAHGQRRPEIVEEPAVR